MRFSLARIMATFLLVVGFGSSAWGQDPWQVNDIGLCYGGGNCSVVRITGTTTINLLNSLSDGLGGTTNGQGTNNTLHLLTGDTGTNPSTSHSGSNIIKWSIASVDQFGNPIAHTALRTFDASNGVSGVTIQGFAINSAGHMYAGNNGTPSTLVEINQDQPSWQPDFAYALGFTIVDPKLHVQMVTTPGTSGATQPTFNDNGGTTADGTVVWTDEGMTVSSFTLPNTTTPGWMAATSYPIINLNPPNVTQILDPNGHVQTVLTPGTSGSLYPPFNQFGGITNDNAVTWTDQGGWKPNTPYTDPSLTQVVGDASPTTHLHKVSTPGTSGSGPTTPAGGWHDDGTTTSDNDVVWTNLGTPSAWAPATPYNPGNIVTDSNGNVEQITSGSCSSNGSAPSWNPALGGTTTDNTCTWTNLGSESQAWVPGTQYGYILNTLSQQVGQIVGEQCGDFTCVQQVSTPNFASGVSGPTDPNTPFVTQPFNGWNQTPSGLTTDGLTWTDQGTFVWQANHKYSQASSNTDPNGIVVDPSGHVQKVVGATDAGESGPLQPGSTAIPPTPNPNPWNDSLGKTVDGLEWQDNGQLPTGNTSTSCLQNELASIDLTADGGSLYFSSGPGGIIQKLSFGANQPLNGGTCSVFADLGPNVTLYGLRVLPPQSMPANCGSGVSGPCPNTNGGVLVVARGTQFRDTDDDLPGITGNGTGDATEFSSGQEIQDICTGQTLAAAPAPPGPSPTTSCAVLLDAGTGTLVATYPLNSSTPNPKALTIDPLISNCTGGCSIPLPPPTLANFWMADSTSAQIFKVPLNGTAFTTYPIPGAVCNSCTGFESIGIYGGEGSNQADLAELFFNNSNSNTSTQTGYFPSKTDANVNSLTLTLYNGTTPTNLYPLAIYASTIAESTCFIDSGENLSCTPTFSGSPVVWKTDIPLPSSGLLALPSTDTLAGNILYPGESTSFSTDAILDAFYDTTTTVDTGYVKPSTAMLYTVLNANGVQEANFGCTYISPVPKCFKNPGTMPVKFTCNNLPPGFLLQNFGQSPSTPWGPRLQIVQYGPSPLPSPLPAPQCTGSAPNEANATSLSGSSTPVVLQPGDCANQLPSTNGAITYRYSPTTNQFIYNWRVPSTSSSQNYTLCTYDDTHQAEPFCVGPIKVANKCP